MARTKVSIILRVLLVLLAVAGIGDAIVLFTGQLDVVPGWLGYFTLIFGVTAAAAAVGLWRSARWGLYSLRAWYVSVFLLLVAAAFAFGAAIPIGEAIFAIVAVVFAALFFVLDRYVRLTVRDGG